LSRVTILGGGVHFASRGGAGMSLGIHFSADGTSMPNAIDLLSGDHWIPPGPYSTWVTCVVAPSASIQRTKICAPVGSPPRTKAMRVPSGDQRASAPLVRKRLREPSAFMIHSDASHRSFTLSMERRL